MNALGNEVKISSAAEIARHQDDVLRVSAEINKNRLLPLFVDADYSSALALFGLHQSNSRRPTVVIEGEEVLDGSDHPALRSRPETTDLDLFKRWIGVPNEAIRSGLYVRPILLPELDPERLNRPLDELSDEEHFDLRKAANAYLFDDSELWQHYRPAIQRHFAPFHLNVYAYDSLEIKAGGRLSLSETPSVLIVDQLVMNEGAGLDVTTTARLVFNTLQSTEKDIDDG